MNILTNLLLNFDTIVSKNYIFYEPYEKGEASVLLFHSSQTIEP